MQLSELQIMKIINRVGLAVPTVQILGFKKKKKMNLA